MTESAAVVVAKSHRPSLPLQQQHQQSHPVAIVGGSYAGLVLANVFHRRTIPFVIFDSRSVPYVHVSGGKFNVPSFVTIRQKLGLEKKTFEEFDTNDGYEE
jgi:cation diffusion facilitator CzcD-associated flavoprotein CzcO